MWRSNMIQQAFVKHHCTELHYVFSTSQFKTSFDHNTKHLHITLLYY